jgi:hypothetical protein
MPTIGWIDALRTYNAGMPSWCVPRKGTPGYERVMRIRQGEQTKGFKEVLEDLERKTSGKPKKDKKSMAIDLGTQLANVPTISEGPPKTEVSTQKSSGSNNKKAMAVVPVNYVAEGGAKKVAEGGAKEKEKVGEVEKELRRLTKKLEPLVFALDQEYQKMGGRKEGATLGKTEHQRQLMKEADEIADQLAAVRDKHIRVYSGTFRVQISDTHTATYKYLRLLDGHIEGTDDKSYWTRLDKYFDDASKNTIEIKDKEVIVNRMKLTPKKKLGAKDYSIQIHNV